MYGSWDMVRDRCNCYFSFWTVFCPFTTLTTQKIKILKNWKNILEISSCYICVPNIMIRWYTVPEICCATDGQMDGRTDGRKKWHIEVKWHIDFFPVTLKASISSTNPNKIKLWMLHVGLTCKQLEEKIQSIQRELKINNHKVDKG